MCPALIISRPVAVLTTPFSVVGEQIVMVFPRPRLAHAAGLNAVWEVNNVAGLILTTLSVVTFVSNFSFCSFFSHSLLFFFFFILVQFSISECQVCCGDDGNQCCDSTDKCPPPTVTTPVTTPFPLNDVPTHGLLAYFPFDGNEKSFTGGLLPLVPRGVKLTTDRFGNPNRAVYFPGNASLSYGTPNLPISGTSFSICLWMNAASFTAAATKFCFASNKCGYIALLGQDMFLNYGFGSYDDSGWWLGINKNESIAFGYVKAGNLNEGPSEVDSRYPTLLTDTLYNLCYIYNKTDPSLTLYLNGSSVWSIKKSLPSFTPAAMEVLFYIGGDYQTYFVGVLQDIFIYHVALTPTEVNQLYNQPNPLYQPSSSPTPSSTSSSPTPSSTSSSPSNTSAASSHTNPVDDPVNGGCSSSAVNACITIGVVVAVILIIM
jgi:hypothetical protein